jgi:hypothetical protein
MREIDMKTIRTTQELINFIEQNVAHVGRLENETIEDEVVWMVCMDQAHMIVNCYSTKDIAHLLLEGVPKYTIETVQDILNMIWDDVIGMEKEGEEVPKECVEEAMDGVISMLRYHYGSTIDLSELS